MSGGTVVRIPLLEPVPGTTVSRPHVRRVSNRLPTANLVGEVFDGGATAVRRVRRRAGPLTPASVPAEEPVEELTRVQRLLRVERVQFFGRLVQQPAEIDDQRNPIVGVLPQQRQTGGAARPRCGASSAEPERPQWSVRTFRHQCPPLARQACARVNRPARPTCGFAWVGSSCQRVFRGLGLGSAARSGWVRAGPGRRSSVGRTSTSAVAPARSAGAGARVAPAGRAAATGGVRAACFASASCAPHRPVGVRLVAWHLLSGRGTGGPVRRGSGDGWHRNHPQGWDLSLCQRLGQGVAPERPSGGGERPIGRVSRSGQPGCRPGSRPRLNIT